MPVVRVADEGVAGAGLADEAACGLKGEPPAAQVVLGAEGLSGTRKHIKLLMQMVYTKTAQ